MHKFTYQGYHIPSGKSFTNTQEFASLHDFIVEFMKWNKSDLYRYSFTSLPDTLNRYHLRPEVGYGFRHAA